LSDQPKAQPAKPEKLYDERYRPQFHFSPMKNWTNDPNGLVFYKGEYHLFFQHNPAGRNWGNMTWGHAVSPDMFHWTQLEHALHPDKLGTIFSGSAVVDENNTAHFQTGEEKVLVCIYTSAGGTSPESQGQPFTQSIAYSNDRGRTWTKYAGNPVLKHVAGGNRDPKVLWHAPGKQWIMALYLDGNTYALFASKDLKQWSKLCDVPLPGGSECPDFFELPVDGDAAKSKWVFWSANNSYLLGTFDGKTFQREAGPLPTHYGRHRYAAQTFSDIPKQDGRRIQIAWMNGAQYPNMPFNQQMSLPVTLTLRTFPEGVRLCTQPVKEVETLRTGGRVGQGRENRGGPSPTGQPLIGASSEANVQAAAAGPPSPRFACSTLPLKPGENPLANISGELFDIELAIAPGTAKQVGLTVRGTPVRYDAAAKRLSCLGTSAPVELGKGELTLRVLVDRSTIEIFAADGRVHMAYGFLPGEDDKTLALFAEGGEATLQSVRVWQLKSAWPKQN
jgi:sucrose-6-phosphate hydrolase SacC (GH32 family)